ncbi:GIY-YIG nuclease family protein [Caulobacter radicis]|uniref:GIY-YIG nuclease family protein n=1 Tax=Caulobacter radicis TaxID=2172650 RepID=UPI001AD83259|nr:GIY-YIG nuclease family protein [Caulobacter radicis]
MQSEERYIAVYIMANERLKTLYIGATGYLNRRAWEHREGLIPGFTKKYGLTRLVWYEPHDDMATAFQRERSLKRWPRQWKINLIERTNPFWEDLYPGLG